MSTSGIPGWLPPLAALLSNVISGLTGFGDGILMQLFFALAGVVGIIPANTDETMRKVVLYISVMPISNLPLLLYIARADLPRCAPWGVLSATSGLAALPLGNWLLLNTSTAPLATTAGVVFVLLAAVLLAAAARDAGREVWAGKHPPAPSPSLPPVESSSANLLVAPASADLSPLSPPPVDDQQPPQGAGAPPTGSVLPPPSNTPRPPPSRCSYRPPPISPRPLATVGATLWLTSIASGVLSGMFGVGGPPLMLAFAWLRMHKDNIRGMSVIYSVFTAPLGVALNVLSPNSVAESGEWGVYCGIVLCTWAGTGAGTWLRRFADTRVVVRIMAVLVMVTGVILLGALREAAAAWGCAGMGVAVGVGCAGVYKVAAAGGWGGGPGGAGEGKEAPAVPSRSSALRRARSSLRSLVGL